MLIELDHSTVEESYSNQTDNTDNVANEVATADENNNEDEVAEIDKTDLSENTTNSDDMGDANGNNNIDELASVEKRSDEMNHQAQMTLQIAMNKVQFGLDLSESATHAILPNISLTLHISSNLMKNTMVLS